MQISRRELIAAAVASGSAAIPAVGQISSQDTENVVFISVERRLSESQLKQFAESVYHSLKAAGSALMPVVLHDGAKIQFPSPYTIHEKLGDYEHSIGCRTKSELIEVARELHFGEKA